MRSTPEEAVRAYIHSWNSQDRVAFADHVHPALREPFLRHYDELAAALSDFHIRIDDLITQNDMVATRLHVSGVHDRGPLGGVAPSGKTLEWESFRFYRVVGGFVAKTWAMQDRLGLYQQLGLVPDLDESVNWVTTRRRDEVAAPDDVRA